MQNDPITVTTTVPATQSETWHYYTESEHVINWNFASEDWHCPAAINDLKVGGNFKITMAAKDGSMKFDLEGTYDEVDPERHISYTLENGRKVSVDFSTTDHKTKVVVEFEPEQDNPKEQQRKGWQSILDNFKLYVSGMEEADV